MQNEKKRKKIGVMGKDENVVEMGIEKVESVNKNLEGDKKKNEKQSINIGGNSSGAVLGVFSSYTCDCC